MPPRHAVLTAAALAAIALPAASAPSLVSNLTRPHACWSRTYDAAHLRAHPRQTVRMFFIGDPGPAWRASQEPGHFNLAFGLRLTGHPDVYSGVAICMPRRGGGAACDIEGDGGQFTVDAAGPRLRITVSRMQLEGEHDFTPDIAAADNRVMLLDPAPQARCAQP